MAVSYGGSGTLVLWVLVLALLTVVVDAVAAEGNEDDGCRDDVYCEFEVARKLCVRDHRAARSSDVCVYRLSSSSGKGGSDIQRLTKEDLKELRDSKLAMKSRILVRKRNPVSFIGMVAHNPEKLRRHTTCNFRSFYALVDPDLVGNGQLTFTAISTGVYIQSTCRNNMDASNVPSTSAKTNTETTETAVPPVTEDRPAINGMPCKERHEWEEKGYVREEGIIFKMSWEKVTWHTARNICRIDGGRLLILSDTDKLNHLGNTSFLDRIKKGNHAVKQWPGTLTWRSMTEPLYAIHFHIGASDLEEEGHYKWLDGTDLKAESSMWQSTQPDNFNDMDDCMTISVWWKNGPMTYGINDDICSKPHSFICEMLPCKNGD